MSTMLNLVLTPFFKKQAFSCKCFHEKQDKMFVITFHHTILFICLGKLWVMLGNSDDGSVYQRITLHLYILDYQ